MKVHIPEIVFITSVDKANTRWMMTTSAGLHRCYSDQTKNLSQIELMPWIFFLYTFTSYVLSFPPPWPTIPPNVDTFSLLFTSFLVDVSLLLIFPHSPPSFTRWVWAGQDKSLAFCSSLSRQVRCVNPSRLFRFQLWYPEGSTQSPFTKADTIRTSDLELSSVTEGLGRFWFRGSV